MSTFDHGCTFASGASRAAGSSSSIRTALAAIAAVSVFSGALVASELVGSPSAAGARGEITPAASFEARWWPGEVTTSAHQRPARMADSDLTFAKGYQQRAAARQALLAARQAEAEASALIPFGRSAALAPREPHRVAARTGESPSFGPREGRL